MSSGVVRAKISGLNSLFLDIERDLERSVDITAFRGFLAIVQYETQEGEYVSDINNAFRSVFLNGTINSTTVDVMTNNTFMDWLYKIQLQAQLFNAQFHATVLNLTINQSDPWHVTIIASINLSLDDVSDTASWDTTLTVSTRMRIDGIEDPVYALESGGVLMNQITQAPTTDFVTGADVTNLERHANNSYYVAHDDAPSFLMRLEGNLSAHPLGIESMVNIDTLELGGGTPKAGYKTVIDHLYFSSFSGDGYQVEGMPEWFMLDNETDSQDITRHEFYEVVDITS